MSAVARQRGVALVLVLWVLALLTVMAGSVMMSQRAEMAMATSLKTERQARALVDAGLQFALLQVSQLGVGRQRLETEDEGQWKADGMLRAWIFAGQPVGVAATPETARIDLNMATPELLDQLFLSAGLDQGEAESLRDAILDWRDPDDAHRPNGAEDPQYRAEGLPYGARDANFETVGELRQVYGVSPEIFRALEPSLTVYTRQRKVNPLFATREVLAALPGMNPALLDEYIQMRDLSREQGVPVPLPGGIGGSYLEQRDFPVYRLYAEVELEGGGLVQGEMVVDIRDVQRSGIRVLERNYAPLVRPVPGWTDEGSL